MSRKIAAQISFQKVKNLTDHEAKSGSLMVLGITEENHKKVAVKNIKTQKELQGLYARAAEVESLKAKFLSTMSLWKQKDLGLTSYENFSFVGVGATKDFYPQNILCLGGKTAQEIKHSKIKSVDIYLDSFFNSAASAKSEDAPHDFAGRPLVDSLPTREDLLENLALGILLGLYSFDRYKTKKGEKSEEVSDKKDETPIAIRMLSTQIDGKKAAQILEKVQIMADAAYLTRDLQTTPGGDLQPAELAKMAQQAGREAGFHVNVWDEKKLKSEGMNGILTVGMGSLAPPRFIILEHNASKKNLPLVVLVGKGITFDSGGICIKPAPGMEEMKMDMSGSAAVIGSLYAISKLKVPVRVIGLIASAENMCSGNAVRPGDIYVAHDGQTVEVINTDAEGRLVLGDALSYAKSLNPDCVIDVATLTGAVVIALGAVTTGMMGNNANLLDGFKRASDRAGERVWELPLYSEYAEEMKSKVADLKNVGDDRGAGSQKGGAFLNYFVKDSYPWIHLDVAGTADTPKGQGAHCPPHVGTAVPMRSMVEFAVNFNDYFSARKKK